MKFLIAVDGSATSARVVKHVITLSTQQIAKPDIDLLFVDPPLLRAVAFELGSERVNTFETTFYLIRCSFTC